MSKNFLLKDETNYAIEDNKIIITFTSDVKANNYYEAILKSFIKVKLIKIIQE